jgi:hypothetical protein
MGSQTPYQEVAGEGAELHRKFLPVLLAVLVVRGRRQAAEELGRLGPRQLQQTTVLGAEGEGQEATGVALVVLVQTVALVETHSSHSTTDPLTMSRS